MSDFSYLCIWVSRVDARAGEERGRHTEVAVSGCLVTALIRSWKTTVNPIMLTDALRN